MVRVHATSVAIGGRALLLFGPSGAGKSDLALRLLDEGALLVSDDYTELALFAGALIARAPAAIRGHIEVRGLGIMDAACADDVPVCLAVDLAEPTERMPEPAVRSLLDRAIPLVVIDPRTPSAAAKIRIAMRHFALPAERG